MRTFLQDGSCLAEIQQLALLGSSSSLHYERLLVQKLACASTFLSSAAERVRFSFAACTSEDRWLALVLAL